MKAEQSIVNTRIIEKLKTYGVILAVIGLVLFLGAAIKSGGEPIWGLYAAAFAILDIGVMLIVIASLMIRRIRRKIELENQKDDWL